MLVTVLATQYYTQPYREPSSALAPISIDPPVVNHCKQHCSSRMYPWGLRNGQPAPWLGLVARVDQQPNTSQVLKSRSMMVGVILVPPTRMNQGTLLLRRDSGPRPASRSHASTGQAGTPTPANVAPPLGGGARIYADPGRWSAPAQVSDCSSVV